MIVVIARKNAARVRVRSARINGLDISCYGGGLTKFVPVPKHIVSKPSTSIGLISWFERYSNKAGG